MEKGEERKEKKKKAVEDHSSGIAMRKEDPSCPAGLPRSAAQTDLLNFVIFGHGVAVKINVRPIV